MGVATGVEISCNPRAKASDIFVGNGGGARDAALGKPAEERADGALAVSLEALGAPESVDAEAFLAISLIWSGKAAVDVEAETGAELEVDADATQAGVKERMLESETSLDDDEKPPSPDRLEFQLLVLNSCGFLSMFSISHPLLT